MSDTRGQDRRHPDVFTAEEAAEYLRLDSERSLEYLRANFGLVGYSTFGKGLRYVRKDLDAVLQRMTGQPTARIGQEKMRMAR